MRMAATLLRKAGYSVSIAAAVAFSASAPAGTLGLSDAPLFLATGAQPNLIMAIDDSGSMDNETLFPTNDGAAWWRSGQSGTCTTGNNNNSFVGCKNNADGTSDIPVNGALNFNNTGDANGVWKKFVYLFPNGLGSGNQTAKRRAGDGNNDHFAIPPIPAFAWSRSSVHNAAYFDPEVVYSPWKDGGGYTFTAASPTAARFDPIFETALTIDLTRDVAGHNNVSTSDSCASLPARSSNDDNFYFKVYEGMTLPEGTCFMAAANGADAAPSWQVARTSAGCQVGVVKGCLTNSSSDGNREFTLPTGSRVAIRYFPATFWLPATRTLGDYGYLPGKRILGGKAPDGTDLVGYQIKPENFAAGKYNAAIQNFANWFQYYRKRHMALRGGLGESFSTVTGVRVDGFTINDRRDVTMASLDDPANRSALYTKFYRDWVRSGGTPNRNAVARIISNFKRTGAGAPITAACQKNFGMLFTDGFSNQPAGDDGITGNFNGADANEPDPYQDDVDSTMADATLSAYKGPLRTDFTAGKVMPSKECKNLPNDYVGPADCNTNLHMNFFAVTLGARGLQFNPDTKQNPYLPAQYPTWPTNFPARHPSAVDDLWHATINGRGQLLNARSPKDIATQLNQVLRSIAEKDSTAASVALNSGSITGDSVVFQSKFFSATSSGELLSYKINPNNGTLITSSEKRSKIAAAADRKIFTRNSSGQGVPFLFDSISSDAVRVRQLAPDPALTEEQRLVEAQRMLNYIRGDDTNEALDGYRIREVSAGSEAPLGDIVNSAPLYVAKPPFRYRDSLEGGATANSRYSKFAADNKDRQPMVYVGANDGMLHAFYADDAKRGQEVFAYVPGAVFSKLPALASPTYGHQFYVDGSPSLGDAYFGGSWHTVVAGGLNKGGQGVYALDVTNPTSFSASNVLWEFTDEDDPDLGFTYSQPTISRLPNGKWYAVFGNGYNNMLDDDAPDATPQTTRVSTTGNAVLYLVELETGAVTKLDTGVGYAQRPKSTIPYGNGLATPSVVDLNGDANADFIYAGDLYGNMWRFDVRSNSALNWRVSFNGAPLFKAVSRESEPQPITVRPEVARGPQGNGVIVLFGTGKYLEVSDRLTTPTLTHSFYGIIDRNVAVTYSDNNRASVLTQQTIQYEGPFPGFGSKVRVPSDNELQAASQGWFLDLLKPGPTYQGEKQVTNPIVRNGAVLFTTLIPSNDPCDFGGDGWLMELDLLNGGQLDATPFDLNNDGVFDDNDLVSAAEGGVGEADRDVVGGVFSDEGIPAGAAVGDGRLGAEENAKAVQYVYLAGSSGRVQMVIRNPRLGGNGRQSWRQIR
jgi:type IV pilus assembly protein PilY1